MSTKADVVSDPKDGLPALVVGDWAPEKLQRSERYIDCAREARRKFPIRTYIDLFCGTGRVQRRKTREFLDGSPIAAWKISSDKGVPFSSVFVADADAARAKVCNQRLQALGAPVTTIFGEAEETATAVARQLKPNGLHLAFLDPYNIGALSFSAIRALSKLKHIDLIVHFSTHDLTRNLVTYLRNKDPRLEKIAPGWEREIDLKQSIESIQFDFMRHWIACVESLGLVCAPDLPLVTNDRGQGLYRLVFFSRVPLAINLWKEACRLDKQRNLF